MALLGGCASRLPPPPPGVRFVPGKYVQDYFFAPGFAPDKVSYALGPFKVEHSRGVTPEKFLPIFQAELARAWKANGLNVAGKKADCQVTATIHQVRVQGGGLRFLRGKISALLVISGTVTKDGQILFAFRDRLSLESPVNPGPPAPTEQELLLKKLSRDLAQRLLTELLLHGLAVSHSKERSANTRTRSLGRFLAVVMR